MTYIFIFLLIGTLNLFDSAIYDRRLKLTGVILSAAILALIAGLRDPSVGADYGSYREFFLKTPSLFDLLTGRSLPDFFFEPGFLVYNVLVASITNNEVVYFLITATVTLTLVSYSAYKLTPYPVAAIAIYFSYDFFTQGLTAMRFGVAAGLGLLFLFYLSDQNNKKSLLPLVIAPTFHSAALALAPLYLLRNIDFRRSAIPLVLVPAFGIGAIGLSEYFVELVPNVLPRSDSVMGYLEHSAYGQPLGLFSLLNVKNFAICALLFWLWPKIKEKSPHIDILAWTFLASTAIRIAFHDLGFITGRISMLLSTVEIILVSLFILALSPRFFGGVVVFIYAAISLLIATIFRGYEHYTHYNWILN